MANVPQTVSFTAGEIPTAAKLNQAVALAEFSVNPPRVIVSRGSGQSVSTPGAFITFTNVDLDTDNMADLINFNDRVTIQTSGLYDVSGQLDWVDNVTGNYRIIELWRNGARFTAMTINRTTAAGSAYATQARRSVACNSGDYLQVKFVTDNSTAVNMAVAYGGSFLEAKWTGR